MKSYFTVPADFSLDTLHSYSIAQLSIPIQEVFGSVKYSGFNSGRHSYVLPNCTQEQFENYVKECHSCGSAVNYRLNASCMSSIELTSEGQMQLLNWLSYLHDIGIRRITVALPPLVDFIQLYFPDISVYLSVITGIDSVSKLRLFCTRRKISGLYVHESLHRNLNKLSQLCIYCSEQGIEVGMIVNTLCDANCPYRHFHYDLVSHANFGKHSPFLGYYGSECKLVRLQDPKLVLRLPWVRPDDIEMYRKIGINKFKLGGRDLIKFGADFLSSVIAYNKKHYDGNLLNLFLCYANVERQDLYQLWNSSSLTNFLEANFSGKYNCLECCNCGKCKDLVKEISPSKEQKEKYFNLFNGRREQAMQLFKGKE